MKKYFENNSGFSLIEVMTVLVVISVLFTAIASTFYQFSRGMYLTKARILANNLAQEKIELLKNISYHRLLATSDEDLPENKGPGYDYTNSYDSRDFDPYKREQLLVGDILFTRQVLIYKAVENTDGTISCITTPDSTSDTGLKKIIVTVLWQEHGTTKNISLTNLKDDPNRIPIDGKIYGYVCSTGTIAWPLTGSPPDIRGVPPSDRARLGSARVVVVENPAWEAYTDNTGKYELNLATGTYTLWISKFGYWDKFTQPLTVVLGTPYEKNIELTMKLQGTVTGFALYNDHLVISQIVLSSMVSLGGMGIPQEQEYVELYNPCTYPFVLGSGAAAWSYALKYYHPSLGGGMPFLLRLDNTDPIQGGGWVTVQPGGFCLLANTSTVVIAGVTKVADACFKYISGFPGYPAGWGYFEEREAGGIALCYEPQDAMVPGSFETVVDKVGWSDSKGLGHTPPAGSYEGAWIVGGNMTFPDPGWTVIRIGATGASGATSNPLDGHAYDSNYNSNDFMRTNNLTNSEFLWAPNPRNTASTRVIPRGGTPAYGAIVTCNDGLSSGTTAYIHGFYRNAYFQMKVATGTWTVIISSKGYFMEITSVTVRTDEATTICNPNTSPAIPSSYASNYPHVLLSSSTEKGFVSGTVSSANKPLSNITVIATDCLEGRTTNLQGQYLMMVSSGVVSVIANPQGTMNNPNYMTETASATIETGQITTVNFNLSQGGRMFGWVTMNGTDGLPEVVMLARKDAIIRTTVSQGGTAPEAGKFYFVDIPTGTWIVQPVLDTSENSTPASKSVNVTVGSNVFVDTFTVTVAWGYFKGTVTEGSKKIYTGVLIVATTGVISITSPPEVNGTYRSGSQVLYGTVSKSDGTYELPVRGGFTYNIYTWYTKVSRDKVELKTKIVTSQFVAQNDKEEINFNY